MFLHMSIKNKIIDHMYFYELNLHILPVIRVLFHDHTDGLSTAPPAL